MVIMKECEEAENFAWWGGIFYTLATSFGVVIGYKLAKAGSGLAEIDLRLNRLERRLG